MQNKTIIIAVGLIIILGLAGYFFFQKSKSDLTPEFQLPQPPQPPEETQLLPETTTTTTSTVETESEEYVVIYTNSGYSPNTLKIEVGETVIFKNQSSQAMWPASDVHPTHRVYSGTSLEEHCPDTTGTAFDACTGIQPGNFWSFTFNKKGTWKYHDHLNPDATGTIVVE